MVLNCDIRQGHVFAFPLCCNWGYLHRLSAGSPKGECRKRERQVAGSCEPASRRRKRASLHQPVVLAIANKNKAAAAVLLSVNRGCNGQRGTACTAPRQTTSKRSNKAGVTEGKGLEIVAPPQLGWEKNPLRIRDVRHGAQSRGKGEPHSKYRRVCSPAARAQRARAKSEPQRLGGPLTQVRGVCGSGVHCHTRPAPVPIRCKESRA
jgi:hypothetical protein